MRRSFPAVLVALGGLTGCGPGAPARPATTPGAQAATKPVATARSEVGVTAAVARVEVGQAAAPPRPAEVPRAAGAEPPASVDESTPARPACPGEMTLLPGGVCIDRWEGSLVQVDERGRERPWSPFLTVKQSRQPLRAVSVPNVVPQGYISGIQAERACKLAGKRLCTAPEWEKACRGPGGTLYPYGNARRAHTCNDDGRPVHPVSEATIRMKLPESRLWYENMEHPVINQLPNTLRRTGELGECTNDFGVFDMVGNLHEWIADADGTFRGGFYMDTRVNGEGCMYATTAHGKGYHDYSTGFRCCKDATTE